MILKNAKVLASAHGLVLCLAKDNGYRNHIFLDISKIMSSNGVEKILKTVI